MESKVHSQTSTSSGRRSVYMPLYVPGDCARTQVGSTAYQLLNSMKTFLLAVMNKFPQPISATPCCRSPNTPAVQIHILLLISQSWKKGEYSNF